MEKIIITKEGKFNFPEKYIGMKRFVVTQSWHKAVYNGNSVTWYHRYPKSGDVPFIEDGCISFKEFGGPEEVFQTVDVNGKPITCKDIDDYKKHQSKIMG